MPAALAGRKLGAVDAHRVPSYGMPGVCCASHRSIATAKVGGGVDPPQLVEQTAVIYFEVGVHENVAQAYRAGESGGQLLGNHAGRSEREQCIRVRFRCSACARGDDVERDVGARLGQ